MSGRPGRQWSTDAILATLSRAPDRTAVIELDGEETVAVSRATLSRLIAGAARTLSDAGVSRGDRVWLWAPNSARWIAVALASARIGAILAPLDAMTAAPDVARLLSEVGGGVLVTEADGADGLGDEVRVVGIATIGESDSDPGPGPSDRDAPVALFRTSGTTGAPKTFHLSLANIATVVEALIDWGGVRERDRVMLPLPMHHVYPLITAALPALTVGAALVLPESPSGTHIATAMRRTGPTVLIGVPRLFEALLAAIDGRVAKAPAPVGWALDAAEWLAARLRAAGLGRAGSLLLVPLRRRIGRNLRLLVSGGAHLRPEIADRLETFGWEVHSGYGLSETASAFAGTFAGKRRGSVGRALHGGTIRIERPDSEGVGEIVLSGPSVFAGYIDNPEANARAFDENGGFRTGDLGYLDADGFLFVTGRAKEVIVLAGGDNLYPEDVERPYEAHAFIAEIAVLERDGALAAVVVPDAAQIADAHAVDVRAAVSIALSEVGKSLPSTWRITDFALTREPLPRTRVGKIRRFMLPDIFERERGAAESHKPQPLSEADAARIASPPLSEVWSALERAVQGRPFDLDSHLQIELGLDSFAWMTLAVEIEEATGVRLELADIAEIETVRDLLDRVERKADAPHSETPRWQEQVEEDMRWLRPRPLWMRWLGAALHAVNAVAMRAFFRLEVVGLENVPDHGRVLVCPNHASVLDPPAIAAAMPSRFRRRAVWAADRTTVFGNPLYRPFCRPLRAFPVEQAMPTVAVELATRALAAGDVQVWFAEGWQSPDGRLMPFRPGVARIVEAARPTVLPVHVDGTFEALPRERRWPRFRKVSVTFGAPVEAADLLVEDGEKGERLSRLAASVRDLVDALDPRRGREDPGA